MRKIFGKVILELGKKDPKFVVITGDVEHEMSEFKKQFPDRFFNLGLCEQSIISIASGMALEGLHPLVYSITPFLIERPFEQLKLDINQQNVPVILVGYADYPTAGPTHAEIDAKSLMSLLKNIKCYFPKNSIEAEMVIKEAHEINKPAFISLKKERSIA
jgi:transketolase